MDILHLVDRLEEIFNAGRPIPLTHKLAVDEDRVLEIIDQMRVSIPDEVKKAQQILNQRDRMLAQAQEAILTQARGARDAVSGVNLDEEAANLLKYQQAYQAAGKVIATANALFDEILSIMR